MKMKRLIFILTACLALFSCTKEPSLSGTAWSGEVMEGSIRKTFAVEFGTATCAYVYSEYNTGELGPSFSTATPEAPYTFVNNQVTIEYSGPASYMGPGDTKPTESYSNFIGTLRGEILELTVRGTVFSLRK